MQSAGRKADWTVLLTLAPGRALPYTANRLNATPAEVPRIVEHSPTHPPAAARPPGEGGARPRRGAGALLESLRRRRSHAPAHLLALLLYMMLTAVATWPLVTRPHRLLLGTPGDSMLWAWNFSWTRRALLADHQLPFFVDYFYRPFDISMLHYTHSFFYGLLYTLGAFVYENPYFWSNLFLMGSFVVAGLGTYALARRVAGDTPGALLAGVIYAFSSFRMVRATGHLNILSTELIPWFLYFLLRGARENRPRHFVAAGLCLAASAWNDYYNTLFLLLFSVLFILLAPVLRLNHGWSARQRWRGLRAGAVLTLILLAPLVWGIWVTVHTTELSSRASHDQYPVGVLNYLLPSPGHTLLSRWLFPLYHFGIKAAEGEGTVFFGYVAIVLMLAAVVGLRRRPPEFKFLMICMLVFLFLSFGSPMSDPDVGHLWKVSMPYDWLLRIPFFKDFRAPARFGGMVALCVAVLAACGFRLLTARRGRGERRLWAAGLIALVMLENLHAPFPYTYDALDPERVPHELNAIIRADPVGGAVLTLPFSHENFPAVWNQTFHHKPIITGIQSRPTESQIQYYTRIDVHDWFHADPQYREVAFDPLAPPQVRNYFGPPGRRAWDELEKSWTREAILRFCYFFDLRYLLIPPSDLPTDVKGRLRKELFPIEREFESGEAWLALLEKQREALPIVIEAGSAADHFYFTENFAEAAGGCRWIVGRQGQVTFRLDAPRDLSISIGTGYPTHLLTAKQTMKVSLGGETFLDIKLPPDWSTHEFRVPARVVRPGYNRILIEAGYAPSPADADLGLDDRPLSIMIGRITIAEAPPAG